MVVGEEVSVTFSKVMVTNLIRRLGRAVLGAGVDGVTRPRGSRLLLAYGKDDKRFHMSVSTGTSLPFLCLASAGGADPLRTPAFYVILHGRVTGKQVVDVARPRVRHVVRLGVRRLGRVKSLYRGALIVRLVKGRSGVVFYSRSNAVVSDVGRISSTMDSLHRILPNHPCFVPTARRSGFGTVAVSTARVYSTVGTGPVSVYGTVCAAFANIDPLITSRLTCQTKVSTSRSLLTYASSRVRRLSGRVT